MAERPSIVAQPGRFISSRNQLTDGCGGRDVVWSFWRKSLIIPSNGSNLIFKKKLKNDAYRACGGLFLFLSPGPDEKGGRQTSDRQFKWPID